MSGRPAQQRPQAAGGRLLVHGDHHLARVVEGARVGAAGRFGDHMLSAYELERLENIKRNEAQLEALGLNDTKLKILRKVKL